MTPMGLTDLPDDVLLLIFPYLKPWEFLSLCAVNRCMHDNFQKSPEYWRVRTSETFRIPIHPLLRADGPRWYWLYKNLRTKTRLYAWGRADWIHDVSGNWPDEVHTPGEITNIADLQCGGWSISFLTSDGIIYLSGSLNDADGWYSGFLPLAFPSCFRQTTKDLYEPDTAIKQFSSGRKHILGLSDNGHVWGWHGEVERAYRVGLSNIEMTLGPQNSSKPGTVTRVVAGWDYSSVYVAGTGIVYWKAIEYGPDIDSDEEDSTAKYGLMMISGSIVPGTSLCRDTSTRHAADDHPIGEVRKHIVLAEHLVFITDTNKVFATSLRRGDVIELRSFSAPGRILQDVQGAFHNFAVFTTSGEVLMGNTSLIKQTILSLSSRNNIETLSLEPSTPPSLQHTDVISISFGDWHFLALHANGKISSYGRDSQACGSLGLGGGRYGVPFRGLKYSGIIRRSDLVKFPFTENSSSPRYVWFEPEKKQWLGYLNHQISDSRKLVSRKWGSSLIHNTQGLLEKYSECIERQGEAWSDFPDIKEQDPDGLGAYFALSVAAAGWQSAALVLVNADLAQKIKDKHVLEYTTCSAPEPVGSLPHGSHSDSEEEDLPQEPSEQTKIKYRFELGDFPTSHLDAGRDIDPDDFDFSTWKYGFPDECFQAST
ncbi:hypothetical protein AJ79_00981 [Helicocarpus griseus UAMH5409]|uniref:F-box domain-containing protein n=1 Tax=Helicocarpus griseus UAMH5409 TaxID=1447875 RepID=A0A2B7Y8T8_9EURO|nr:hypothetical protein AJ79_00981 [Helicocarpus griseus UAMH5409]